MAATPRMDHHAALVLEGARTILPDRAIRPLLMQGPNEPSFVIPLLIPWRAELLCFFRNRAGKGLKCA